MIYTVTLNPAVDYVTHISKLETGNIMRSEKESVFFGGKGINVSTVLHELGVLSVAMGFLAGFTGKAIEDGMKNKGILTDFVYLENSFTRINIKIRADEETDIIMGLDMGGDDYITKPFKLNELLSRIKALLRRSLQFSKAEAILEANGIRVDTTERLVWKNGEPVDLPLVEYKLLCLFMQNPNHLMPREMILDRMWDGNGNFVDDNTLSVYIRRLRNKIEDTPNAPKYLLTERGIGYKWVVE